MRAVLVIVALGACDPASSDPALDAVIRVEGAQYRPGPFPGDEGGPATIGVSTVHSRVTIGARTEGVRGVLEPTARAAVIGIEGFEGAWLIPAGVPGLDTPGLPTASGVFRLAEDFAPGPFVVQVAASDDEGRFGASGQAMLIADEQPAPTGELVVGLVWDGPADLDIHVVTPEGEAWSGKPNTMKPPVPGEPVDPEEYKNHGLLDHDGNRDCAREPFPNEHVIWTMAPPTGEYIVRVDARSMCGAAIAHWYVAVYRNEVLVEEASVRGASTAADVVRLPLPPARWHGAGAGTFALRFSL